MSTADLADFVVKKKGNSRPGLDRRVAPALAWSLLLAMLAFAVPKFEQVTQDFGIELGWAPWLVVRASHLWAVLALLVVALLLLDRPVREVAQGRGDGRIVTGVWSSLVLGVPWTAIAFVITTIGSTMIDLAFRMAG